MGKQEFDAKLVPMGENNAWTGLIVPFSVQEVFGTKARVSIKGTINGFPIQSSLFPNGNGTHCLMVNKTMQQGAKVTTGDKVRVLLEQDTAPRVVAVPKDLQAALNKNKEAKKRFEKLPPSHKKEHVRHIDEAKKEETRQRRIEKTIDKLLETD
jgi:hypothetical protein